MFVGVVYFLGLLINVIAESFDGDRNELAALKVAALDVKVQVEFNPRRVTAYRQIGYAKHQLTKEQFRDNSVDAAELAAAEAGNALYTVEVNPSGSGPLATVRVRFKIPGTRDYREHAWDVPFNGKKRRQLGRSARSVPAADVLHQPIGLARAPRARLVLVQPIRRLRECAQRSAWRKT